MSHGVTTLPLYQVDAFADRVFRGNPAAVVPLESWLPDPILRAIAAENNLAETAFYVPRGEHYDLRWFTPTHEVPLCGHATLAAAFVILTILWPNQSRVRFSTLSGMLEVERKDHEFTLDFPRLEMEPVSAPPEALLRGLGTAPQQIFRVIPDPNFYAVYEDESAVRLLQPDLSLLATLHPFGVVITAPGRATDIVSRCFAPSYGIPEDPVTGSIHCALAPYWSGRLGKDQLTAFQASPRGGHLVCRVSGDRVLLTGSATLYLEGAISVPL